MELTCVFTLVLVLRVGVALDATWFNSELPCEETSHEGRELQFAELIIGKRVFNATNCGVIVPLDEVDKEIPVVKFAAPDDEKLYLVAMLDPDAPSFDNPECRHWVHFIYGNVRGKHLAIGKIRGNIYGEYNPPNPQPGQGVHRFYFFVFEQVERLSDGIHINSRCGFNIEGFMKDFDLKPVAMNMFRSEYQNVILVSELIIV